jgi:putative addiction module killer protein
MIEARRYITESGHDVLGDWLTKLKDVRARAKIAARIARLSAGNFGDCKPLRDGVWELRIDWGPGIGCITRCSNELASCCCAVATSGSNSHQARD